ATEPRPWSSVRRGSSSIGVSLYVGTCVIHGPHVHAPTQATARHSGPHRSQGTALPLIGRTKVRSARCGDPARGARGGKAQEVFSHAGLHRFIGSKYLHVLSYVAVFRAVRL